MDESPGIHIRYRHCPPDKGIADALYGLLSELGRLPALQRREPEQRTEPGRFETVAQGLS